MSHSAGPTAPSDGIFEPEWATQLAGRDIVIVSPQFWGDYWVSKHWIAHELSRRLRTAFVEPPIWIGGVVRHPWAHRAHWGRLLRPRRAIDPKLSLVSPTLQPKLFGEPVRASNDRTLAALRGLGIRRPVVLNFTTNHDLVRRLDGIVTVYYCVDPAFAGPGEEEDEALTCRASDLVYAVSEAYQRHLAPLFPGGPVPVIPHGYAFEHARRVADDPALTAPPELAGLPRPILGYVGSIHDAYVDVSRVERLSAARPEASIVLIGPYRDNPLGPDLSADGLRRLRRLPNVHLLGPRHFLDVPRYVRFFDVCILLVNIAEYGSRAATGTRTHFKWLLYMALGKPVIAPYVAEAESISGLVYLARDEAGYLEAVGRALDEGPELAAPRIEYASQFSFGRTLDAIARPIGERLARCP